MYDSPYMTSGVGLNEFISTAAFIVGAAQLILVFNIVKTMKTGKKAELIARILSMPSPGSACFELPDADTIKSTIMALQGTKLAQRTPDRVAHRRADLIRRREVVNVHEPVVDIMEDNTTEIEFTLRCESGTYVKETIHGDNGRTQPSVASLLKAKCEVLWLDVGDIHAD